MPPNQNQNPYPPAPEQPNQNPYPAAPPPQPQSPYPPQQQGPTQQFPAPAQQPEQNPYDFFMKPENQEKKTLFSGGGSPMKKLLLIVGAAIIGLIIIMVIVAVMAGNKGDTAPLLSVAQQQQEIVRLSGEGAKKTRNVSYRNFAVTTQVAVTSAQKDLLAHMEKKGIKVDKKQLALGHKSKTDTALSAAQASNTYDTTFVTVMTSEFKSYASKLRQASAAATSKKERDLIKKQLSEAEMLFSQLKD